MNLFDAFVYTLVDFIVHFPKYFLEALVIACLCFLIVSSCGFIKKVYHRYLCIKYLNFVRNNIENLFLNIFEIILANYPESKKYTEFKGNIVFFDPRTNLAFRRYFVKLNFDLTQKEKENYQEFVDNLIFYIYDNTAPDNAYSDIIFSMDKGKGLEFKNYLFGLSNRELKEKLKQIKLYVHLFKTCCILDNEHLDKNRLKIMHRNINFTGTYLNIDDTDEPSFESVSLISSDG